MRYALLLADVVDAVNRLIARVVIWLLLAMVLIGFLNAAARYLGRWIGENLTSNMMIEAQWYIFSLIFLFMAAHTLQRDGHVRVDVLYGRLHERSKAWIDLVFTVVFMIPFCTLILYLSWGFAAQSIASFETSPDPGGLARWPLKTALPVAFALLILQGVSVVIRNSAFLLGRTSERHATPAGPEGI